MSEFDDDGAYSDLSDEFRAENSGNDETETFEREDAFLLANLSSLSVEPAPAAPAPAAEALSLVDVSYSRDLTKINVPMPDKALFVVPTKSKASKGKLSVESKAARGQKDKDKGKEKEKKKKKADEEKGSGNQKDAPLKYGSVTLAKRQPGAPVLAATPAGTTGAAGDQTGALGRGRGRQHPAQLLQRISSRSAQNRDYQSQALAQQEATSRGVWQFMSDRSSDRVMPAQTELRATAPEFNPCKLLSGPTDLHIS